MIKKCSTIALGFYLILINSSLYAQDNMKNLSPAGGWTINKAPNICIVKRQFGEGKDAILFKIGMGLSYYFQDMEVSGVMLPRNTLLKSIKLIQNDNIESEEFEINFFRLKERPKNGVRWYSSPNIYFGKSDTDQNLEVFVNEKAHFKLMLGNMNKAITALEKCQDKLYEKWGINAQRQRQLQQLPTPANNPDDWLKDIEYIDSYRHGIVKRIIGIKVDVDAAGNAGKCVAVLPTSAKSLNKATCKAIDKNARFNPAIGPDGKDSAGTFFYRVVWEYDVN